MRAMGAPSALQHGAMGTSRVSSSSHLPRCVFLGHDAGRQWSSAGEI